MNSGVYLLRNTVTGDQYVGGSTWLKSRRWQHFNGIRKKNHPVPAIRALSEIHPEETFVFEVLEHCSRGRRLIDREKYWIRKLNPSLNRLKFDEHGKFTHPNVARIGSPPDKVRQRWASLTPKERKHWCEAISRGHQRRRERLLKRPARAKAGK
jgi:group I intron endonuclease